MNFPLPTRSGFWLVTVFFAGVLHPCFGSEVSQAKALFKNPPREYSSGPLWVWNDLLTEEQIRDTLRDLAGQKIKQVWVHPRPGMMTPYLSADWFRLWKVALREAQRLDMNVWIYDENSYPSGFAGGLVPEAMPESRGRGLALRETDSAPRWSDDVVAVYRLDGDKVANVSTALKAGEHLEPGRYLVASQVRAGNSPWHGNRCYVNLLSPGVTEKFLELTLEPYRREVGREFGRRIPGVFTDEPNIRPAGGFPWSEVLVQAFQERWGYNLLDCLPSLAKPVGDWQRVRHNYYQVLNEQFIERWGRPYHDYCETNHLQFTGHYWDHDWPDCGGVPDNMAMYAWHQWPSIDCLMNQYAEHTHAQFGNVRMVKELSSVANQLARKRTLCETYGAGGWDLRFEDMKRIGDWLEVLGVNTINQHLSYVTIRGARKRDHPQSFSYHEPWWEAYHVSAEYFARLSAALSQGEQINRVLLLEPTTTAWMYQGDRPKLQALGDAFFKLIMQLEAAQVEYDIGCEDIIGWHGKVIAPDQRSTLIEAQPLSMKLGGPAALQVGARTYSTVLIPPFTENLNRRTAQLLQELLRADSPAEVFCLGDTPARIDGTLAAQVGSLTNYPSFVRLDTAAFINRVVPLPGEFGIQRASGDKGILFHHRRVLGDGELLFLVNTGIQFPSAGKVTSNLKSAEKWDLYTGKTGPYPFEPVGQGLQAEFELPPSGSLLLFLSRRTARPAPEPIPTETVLSPAGNPEIRRLEPNVLTVDFVDVSAGGETRSNIYFYQANQFAWKKNGMDRNPWDSAVQFKDELISKRFPAESGFTASYKFTIDGAVPANLAIVIERPDLYSIACNGHTVTAPSGQWWLDKAFGRIPIAQVALTGENVVTITAHGFTMFHEIEPAYVLGDFSLRPTERGFVIAPDQPLTLAARDQGGGWNKQGLPFYGAGVAYRESFDVKSRDGSYKVSLRDWLGSVAKISVNGKPAGHIDAPPWQGDVTKYVRRGQNQIEVTVVGTLKNTLGPHHGNPALGAAWPSAFQSGPASGPPPGKEYSTVGYGLFQPFVLKNSLPE